MSRPFSFLERIMHVLGSWPVRRNSFFPRIRWTMTTLIELVVATPAVVQMFSANTYGTALENLMFVQCSGLSFIKNIFLRFHFKRMVNNIEAANSDWFHASKNKESFKILKRYDRYGKIATLMLFSIGYACIVPYVAWVLLKSQPRVDSSKAATRNFIIPSDSWLKGEISDGAYRVIIVVQVLESAVFITRQSSIDTFFFSTVMHLCGQLQILRKKFREWAKEKGTQWERRQRLNVLIGRHREIMRLIQNIEKTFNMIILIEVFVCTLLIGLLGFRLVLSVRTGDLSLTMKCFVIMLFFLVEILIYAYAGDILQTTSEMLFREIYHMSWLEHPLQTKKDLLFIMMVANKPLHITGGKFFRMSCKTVMSVMSTAFSYVSVLQAVIKT